MNLRKTKYIILLAFLLVGIGLVIATTTTKSIQYYVTVDELLREPATYRGRELKVAGKVVAQSLEKETGGQAIRFRVENAGKTLEVAYRGAVPDTFKEGADVVVTGTWDGGGEFPATQLLAKCASRYEEKLRPGLTPPPPKR